MLHFLTPFSSAKPLCLWILYQFICLDSPPIYMQKPSLLCVQSSSCDLCRELLEGIAYTIYVSTQSELHCMVMSKMCHMR